MPATITPSSPTSSLATLQVFRDKSATFAIAVFQADGVTPQNLTGAVLYFNAVVGNAAGEVDIAKSSPSGGITITGSPTAGLASLALVPADTVGLPFGGTFVGPCELTMALGGQNFELASGSLEVLSNVGTP